MNVSSDAAYKCMKCLKMILIFSFSVDGVQGTISVINEDFDDVYCDRMVSEYH